MRFHTLCRSGFLGTLSRILYLIIGAFEVLYKLGDTFHAGEVEANEGDLLAASGPQDQSITSQLNPDDNNVLPHDGLPRRLALHCVPATHHQPPSPARHGKGCVVANS